ncbi:cell wall hydrolase [Niallia sp. XMNu-256]|uniref:cell wall hydrolase n=1 Tax=Niallia sp. XMNu-256 TaxID=3082444 RepID=UPI0030CFA8DD
MKKLTTLFIILGTFLVTTSASAYTVVKGDTMSKLTQNYNLSLDQLAITNPQIQNFDLIDVGQRVNIASSDPTTIPTITANNHEVTEEDHNIIEVSSQAGAENHLTSNENTSSVAGIAENISNEVVDLLARLVRSEANTESCEGKKAVAEVVLNRMENSQFPDSITEVIYEPGQFQPVTNGEIHKPTTEESMQAVQAAFSDGHDVTGDSLFFYNPDIATNRWLDTRDTTVVIGDHVLKK